MRRVTFAEARDSLRAAVRDLAMLARRLALAIGLLCGLIGTQWPEFSQQYRQRLGGALDELSRIVAAFDAEAASRSLTSRRRRRPAEGQRRPAGARARRGHRKRHRAPGAPGAADRGVARRRPAASPDRDGGRLRSGDRKPDAAGLRARGSRDRRIADRRRPRAGRRMGRDASLRLADPAAMAGAAGGAQGGSGVRRRPCAELGVNTPFSISARGILETRADWQLDERFNPGETARL